MVLGYSLGNFFFTNSSGHPAGRQADEGGCCFHVLLIYGAAIRRDKPANDRYYYLPLFLDLPLFTLMVSYYV
jgi:hypothetical protein